MSNVRRCVLDTDGMVAAFRSDAGASRQVLLAALAGRFDLLLSVPLMLEYEAVLSRPEHRAASGASARDVADVLDGLAALGKRVRLAFRWRPALPDPSDDMVLETAINGHAHAIVTFNERDFNPIAAEFGCLAMRPGELLRVLATEAD
ncbi:MAG TPA: PIN domain-containing protein [Terriglobia bacterium]|nr:PIN domain-containing protein [Terriglobia bacterium]